MQDWPIVSFLLARWNSVAFGCIRALNNVFILHSTFAGRFLEMSAPQPYFFSATDASSAYRGTKNVIFLVFLFSQLHYMQHNGLQGLYLKEGVQEARLSFCGQFHQGFLLPLS